MPFLGGRSRTSNAGRTEQPLRARTRQRIEDRLVTSLFEELKKRESITKSGRDLATIVTLALATIVHLVTLAILLAGIAFIALNPANIFAWLFGLLLIGIAYLCRPRFGTLPEDSRLLSREETPELFALIDQVSTELRGPRIDAVLLNADYNAAAGRYGLRWRPYVCIGLPLWNILDPQERVAILGHEIGHFVNGDLSRSFFVGSALDAVAEVYLMFRLAAEEGFDHWLAPIVQFALWSLSLLPLVFFRAFVLVTYRAGQRGEYLADQLGAKAAGTDAASRAFEKLLLGKPCLRRLYTSTLRGDLDEIWERSRAEMKELSRTGLAKLATDAENERLQIDREHPPTHLRIRLLKATPQASAQVVLDTGRSRVIDKELAAHHSQLAVRLRDEARAGVYV